MENNVFLYYEVVKGLLNNIETTNTLSNSDYINLKKAYDNLLNEIQSFLIYSYDFHYGYFLINLKIVYKIKKGFVMGITLSPGYPVLIVNPITVGKYELKEIIYLLCHEIEHLILGHLSAIISMNPYKKQNIHQLLNIACDAAVNDQLNNEIENGLSIISCPSEAVTSETISKLTNQFVIKNHHFMYYYEKLMNNENISSSLPQMSMHADFNIDIKFGDDETSESDSNQASDEFGSQGKMSVNSSTNNGNNSNENNSSIQINLNNSTSDNGKQNSNNENDYKSKSTIDPNNSEENNQSSNQSINISNNNNSNDDSVNQQANNGGSDNNNDNSNQFQDSNSLSQSNGEKETPDLQSYGKSDSNLNELNNNNEQSNNNSNGDSNNNLDGSISSDQHTNSGQLSDETQNQSEKESNNTNQNDENNSNENPENNEGSDGQDFYDITKEDLSSDFENLLNSTDSFDDLSQLANGNYDSDSVEQIINTYIEKSVDTMSHKARGLFSSKYKSVIKKINKKPIVNWKKELRKFLGNVPFGTRKTIMRLNRRQPERIDLRGTMTDKVIKIVLAIDTSGSMDPETLSIVLNEIHKIVKDKKSEITIIECDANIHKVYKVKKINNIQYDLRGRGGTSFSPVIEYLNHNKEYRDALLIYFTDGYGEEQIPKPLIYRLLWIVFGQTLSLNKKHGKIIYINPSTFKIEGKDNG